MPRRPRVMITASVYSAPMEMNGATLPRRVTRLMRAKLHLVLFAIALAALDLAAPLLASWALTRRSAEEILDSDPSLLGALGGGGSGARIVAAAVVVFSAIALTACLRAGYIRSLVGRFHLTPTDGGQFRAMTDLVLVASVVGWVTTATARYALDHLATEVQQQALVVLAEVVTILTILVLLYVDYVIVVSGLGFLAAVRRSWLTVEANWFLSVVVTVASVLATGLVLTLTTLGPQSLGARVPLLAVEVLALGLIGFVVDVVLIVVYIDSMERRRIRGVAG
jgi:hypothetical protein